jgi:hypothetical protein
MADGLCSVLAARASTRACRALALINI